MRTLRWYWRRWARCTCRQCLLSKRDGLNAELARRFGVTDVVKVDYAITEDTARAIKAMVRDMVRDGGDVSTAFGK